MKISQNISFSKQLIIYLILVLFVVFFLISLALVNSLEQFINNNAYSQAKAIANNALIIFEREIARIESIPQNVTDMQGELNYKNIPDLPIRILRSYKTLIGSSVHYDLKNPEVADFIHCGFMWVPYFAISSSIQSAWTASVSPASRLVFGRCPARISAICAP